MSKAYQVMSSPSLATFGVFHGESPEEALDAWAAAFRWGSWREAQEKGGDLFKKGFRLEEGFRILLLS